MTTSEKITHVSLTEAKQRLGELVKRAAYGGETVVLEFRGKPVAAIVGYGEVQDDQEVRTDLTALRERGVAYGARDFESVEAYKKWRDALTPEQLKAEKSTRRKLALEALQRLDEVRERIAARTGRLPDSTELIRQMRCVKSVTSASAVCPDTSVLAKLVLDEEGSGEAHALWAEWGNSGVELLSPHIVRYEFVSVIWQRQRRGTLDTRPSDRCSRRIAGIVTHGDWT